MDDGAGGSLSDSTAPVVVEAFSHDDLLFTVHLRWVPRSLVSLDPPIFPRSAALPSPPSCSSSSRDIVVDVPAALSMWPFLHSACDPRTTTLRLTAPAGSLVDRRLSSLPVKDKNDDVSLLSRLSATLDAAKKSKTLANADFAAKRFTVAMERYAAAAHEASFCAVLCFEGSGSLPGTRTAAPTAPTCVVITKALKEAREVGAVCLSNYAQSTLEWIALPATTDQTSASLRQKIAAADRALRRIRRARNLLPPDTVCQAMALLPAGEANAVSQHVALRMKILLREAKLLAFLENPVESTRILVRVIDEADRALATLASSDAGEGIASTATLKVIVDVYESARCAARGEMARQKSH